MVLRLLPSIPISNILFFPPHLADHLSSWSMLGAVNISIDLERAWNQTEKWPRDINLQLPSKPKGWRDFGHWPP